MDLTRRKFMTLLGGSAAGAVLFEACGVPEDELIVQAPIQMPEDMVTGLDNWYATLCRQCPTSEGVVVRVIEGRAIKVEGNVDYPVNRGKHSARCEAALQAHYDPDRIRAPLLRTGERGAGKWEEISWTDAVSRLSHQLDQVSNHSEVVFVTDPVGAHLGMVVERFVTRYGARHVPYEPLGRTTLRAAIKQVFDQDLMPEFDIDKAGYILSFGADFLNTWESPVRYARGFGEFRQGPGSRGTFVHVDSRMSMTGANADQWVYVRPGREGLMALSIAQVLVSSPDLRDFVNQSAADALTGGDRSRLDRFAPDRVAGAMSDAIPASDMAEKIRQIAHDFATKGPALAIGGGPAAAHTNGLATLAAIYSLNYLVDSVGNNGTVVFNPPSALTSVGAAPAAATFAQMQGLATDMKQGRVKVLMVRDADPMYGLPEDVGFRDASFDVPFIFSFSGRMDDTTAMADLVLPEHGPFEDWGTDIPDPGPGYQIVGFQQPVVRPFFESRGVHLGTKSFPDVLLTLAQILSLDLGLPGNTFQDVLRESARDLVGSGSVRNTDFESFWNGVLQRGGWWDTNATYTGSIPTPPELPLDTLDPEFDGPEGTDTFYLAPFASASLTDGRGAHLPWLQATPDPITTATWRTWVEINLKKAQEMGIKEGDVVSVVSSHGQIEALALPHPGISPEVVAVPIGQGHRAGGRFAEGRGSNVLSILSPDMKDTTGALAWAANRVRLVKTGEWARVPKFENSKPELSVDEDHQIIQLTRQDT